MPSHADRVRKNYPDEWWLPWRKRRASREALWQMAIIVLFAIALLIG